VGEGHREPQNRSAEIATKETEGLEDPIKAV
jgi:hypothetical protein